MCFALGYCTFVLVVRALPGAGLTVACAAVKMVPLDEICTAAYSQTIL